MNHFPHLTSLTPTTLINSTPVIPFINHFPHLTSLTPTTLVGVSDVRRLSSLHERIISGVELI